MSGVLSGALIFAVIVCLVAAGIFLAGKKGEAENERDQLRRASTRRRKVDEILASGQRSRDSVVAWMRSRGGQ